MWGFGWGVVVLLYMIVFVWLLFEWVWCVLFVIGVLFVLLVLYICCVIFELLCVMFVFVYGDDVLMVGIFDWLVLCMMVVGGLIGVGVYGGYYVIMIWLLIYLKIEWYLLVFGIGMYFVVVIVVFICGCFLSVYL